jgi:hypothetical protein
MSDLDLLTLASTDVATPLPAQSVHAALSSPPFLFLPDTFNTRDLGLLPGSPIRPGLAYRSGGFLAGLSTEGKSALAGGKVSVSKVFDLRSVREHEARPDPDDIGGGAVEVVWVRPDEEDAKVGLEDFVAGEGEEGYVKMYMDVLKVYQGGIRAVLEHVRDGRGEEGFLFHCTGESPTFFFYPWIWLDIHILMNE